MGKTSATLVTKNDSPTNGNNDFVIEYKLADSAIETGLLTHRGETENTFLLLLEPPARLAPTEIIPKEFVFVVDVSGSMTGFPLDTAKVLVKGLLGTVRAHDTFNVVLFAGSQEVLATNSLPATEENISRGLRFLDQLCECYNSIHRGISRSPCDACFSYARYHLFGSCWGSEEQSAHGCSMRVFRINDSKFCAARGDGNFLR